MAMWRTFSALTVVQAAFTAGITWAIAWADQAYPPPLDKAAVASREVLDGDGALLRAFTTPDSKWRLAVKKRYRFHAVARLVGLVPAELQQHGQRLGAVFVVVHDQHTASGGGRLRRLRPSNRRGGVR